jgi:hypothetical protein
MSYLTNDNPHCTLIFEGSRRVSRPLVSIMVPGATVRRQINWDMGEGSATEALAPFG